jgi:predicted transposase/invertase (TIGR01784 family)
MGDPDHKHVLLDFLNAVLSPTVVVDVTILNPTPLAELLTQRSFTVDVLAQDSKGWLFQVEMQGWNHAALKQRILWNWAGLYHKQISKGQESPRSNPSSPSGWSMTSSGRESSGGIAFGPWMSWAMQS